VALKTERRQLETFAGAASRWGQRLVVSLAAQRSWPIFTWDISTAFLQGATFEELAQITNTPVRKVAFRPPKGSEWLVQDALGLTVDLHTHV
jgi:hypothetical protein